MPVGVEADGLMHALKLLVENCDQMNKVDCRFDCESSVTVENKDTATYLYRIAQEAIRNAMQHGQPSQIVVRLAQDDDVVLSIQDDGSGMSAGKNSRHRTGLRIIQFRLNLIGGKLKIDSQPGGGTTLTCRVPIAN